MTPSNSVASALPHVRYYAPSFVVEVDGSPLSPLTNGDVLSLSVKLDLEQMGSFDLTIANTNELRSGFKYSDTNIFDIGRQVHVKIGYADEVVSMITGQITSMAAQFPQSGPSTVTVSGQDGMFRLKDRRPAQGAAIQYLNMADWEIAQVIAQRNGLQIAVTREGPTHAEVIQRMTDDATFLMERAARIDFECHILTNPRSGRSTLHFVRPTDGRDSSEAESFALRWGENLISFRPTVNLADQVESVTVRGWDPATKQTLIARAGPEDLPRTPGAGESGPSLAGRTQQGKQDVVVDAPVATQEEAFALARTLLAQRAYRFVTVAGQIIGRPELRPGQNLLVDGVGMRFNGNYHVTGVEHSIGSAGFLTSFDARRMHQGVVS